MSVMCVPQVVGLTVGDPKPTKRGTKPKCRANGFGWLLECMEERASKSITVDRSLTSTNDYHGLPRSARRFWADFQDELATEHQTVKHYKDGTTRLCKFRADGVPLVGSVFNPEDEWWRSLSDEDKQRCVRDHLEVMEEFEPHLFSQSNIRVMVTHNDEGGDIHIAYDTFDDAGKCWGYLMDSQLRSQLNKYYPAAMRERGWDFEDVDTPDWDRFYSDEEYAAERREKWRQGRLNTNEYVRKQNEQAAQKAAEARLVAEEGAAKALERELASTLAAIAQDARTADAKAEQQAAEKARDAARTSTAQAKRERMAAEQKRDRALAVIEAYEGETYYTTDGMSHRGIKGVKKELKRLEAESDKARQDAEDTRVAADNYRTAMVAALYEGEPTRAELEYEQAYETMLDEAQVMVDAANEANAAADEWLETHRDESDPSKHVEYVRRILYEVPDAIGDVEAEEHGVKYGQGLREFFANEWARHVKPFVRRVAEKIAERIWPTPEQQAAKERLARNRELARAAQDAIDRIQRTQRQQTQRKAPKPQPQRTMIQNAPRRRSAGHGGPQIGG